MKSRKFVNNTNKRRYELHVGRRVAIAEYIVNNEGVIFMTHFKVPVLLEVMGVGTELVELSLCDIKEKGKYVFPICPFVKAFIKKHPEWEALIKKF